MLNSYKPLFIILKIAGFLVFIFKLFDQTALADAPPEQLPPVIVSEERLTDPPFNTDPNSRADFYTEDLLERGMNRLQDIGKQVANFAAVDQGLGSFRQVYSMRGLTNTANYGAPATVFYVDDVAYSSPVSYMGQLFDIDWVAVYRNAQPGRFGRNAYAGAVDIQTNQANNQLKSGVALDMGSYDHYLVNANASGALIKDELYFSLSGVHDQRDGFLYNNYLNNHPDAQDNYSGRSVLNWKPTAAWDIRLTLNKDDFNYGNGRFVRLDQPVPFQTSANVQERLQQNADGQALRIAHETAGYNIVSISSRRLWSMSPFLIDLDLTPAPIAQRGYSVKEETFTQELRLTPKGNNEVWDWRLGGFFSNSQYAEHQELTVAGSLGREWGGKQTRNYAVFGNLSYRGVDKLNVYTDLRLDYVNSHMDSLLFADYPNNPAYARTLNYDTFFASPKWGADYKFSEHNLIYASTGFGFKPGGLVPGNIDPRLYQFGRESSWQNTLGLKNAWFNQRLKNNVAVFYYDISNYQVERFFANGDYSDVNAKKVSSYGAEFETQASLANHFSLENTIGYTHIRFDNHTDPLSGASYTGNTAPFVPVYTMLTALQYKQPQGFFARAEWQWKGKTYFDEANDLYQKDYSIINLRLGYAKNQYSAYVYVNNLADNYYYTTKIGVRGAPGDPQTAGVRLTVNF